MWKKGKRFPEFCLCFFLFFLLVFVGSNLLAQSLRPDVYLKIKAVNPTSKEQTVEIKSYLPAEVIPEAVVSTGGLELRYDAEKACYYVYKKDVAVAPGETLIFTIEIKDVWVVPEEELQGIKVQTETILSQVQGEYQRTAKEIAGKIFQELKKITESQTEAGRGGLEEQIAGYRQNCDAIIQVKGKIERMKVIQSQGEAAARMSLYPEKAMMEKSKLKSDVPSKTATWMVIFVIMGFIAILGGTFFFAWVRSSRSLEKTTLEAGKSSFPESEPPKV
ncbi:MAG: hypothetical protein V2A65_04905 [Candidatus Omnitrophota bacterium]